MKDNPSRGTLQNAGCLYPCMHLARDKSACKQTRLAKINVVDKKRQQTACPNDKLRLEDTRNQHPVATGRLHVARAEGPDIWRRNGQKRLATCPCFGISYSRLSTVVFNQICSPYFAIYLAARFQPWVLFLCIIKDQNLPVCSDRSLHTLSSRESREL